MGTTLDHPATVLFGKTRRAVLSLLYGHPSQEFYLREIARISGTGLGAAQREMGQLTAAGIVVRRASGRQVYFQANPKAPIFADLRNIVTKTFGVADLLRSALDGLANRIRVAFVYGSVARGQEDESSDVDVMVIGDATFSEIVSALAPCQEKLGREVNPSVYPVQEFRSRLSHDHPFLREVLRKTKVFLIGNQRELSKLAKERLAR
jgi:predicted nucleotidyltransferase